MSLSLLAPAALALSLLLLGPILAHLTRRQPQERQPFGLMFLLDRLQRQVERRRRISDRWLLLLRLLVLSFVILAATRPELRLPETSVAFGSTGRVVILLDNSLSMDQRLDGEPLLALARRDAAAIVRGLPEGVQVALITAGGNAAQLSELTPDKELVAAMIEAAPQSILGTDLHGALVYAREILGEQPGEVLIYSDASGPGVVERASEDLAWLQSHGSAVLPRVQAPKVRRNIVPISAEYGDGLEGGTVSVKLVNYGPDAREVATTLALPDGSPITMFLNVPAAGEQLGVVEGRVTVPRQVQGGVASITIDDPDLPADNTRYFHLPRIGASRVLVVDGDPGSTPTTSEVYFLERALVPWGTAGVAVDVVSPSGIGELDPNRHRVVFLANVGDPALVGPPLVDFVRKGGGLLLAMGRNISAARYNSALGAILPAELDRPRVLVSPDDTWGAPLALPDPGQDALFQPFIRAGLEGFGRVRVGQAMALNPFTESPEVHTALRSRDGLPLLVTRSIGAGRVVLWCSTLDLGWTNLPLQSIFVPFIQRLAAWMGGDLGGNAAWAAGIAGELLKVPLPSRGLDPEVIGPDGQFVAVDRALDAVNFTPTQLGAYTIRAAVGPPLVWVAVNPPPAESDVRSTTSLEEAQLAAMPDRLQRKIKLHPWLLLCGAGIFVAAAYLGGRRHAET